MHDARVFANSSLFVDATAKRILHGDNRTIQGCEIPPLLVADSAYPLLPWLLKPFINHGSLTQDQKNFNYHLSRARIVSENAFGRLKARWCRLIKQNDMQVASVPNVVVACCILHNICEIHCEEFDNAWIQESAQQSQRLQQPTDIPHQGGGETDPDKIRDTLVKYLSP